MPPGPVSSISPPTRPSSGRTAGRKVRRRKAEVGSQDRRASLFCARSLSVVEMHKEEATLRGEIDRPSPERAGFPSFPLVSFFLRCSVSAAHCPHYFQWFVRIQRYICINTYVYHFDTLGAAPLMTGKTSRLSALPAAARCKMPGNFGGTGFLLSARSQIFAPRQPAMVRRERVFRQERNATHKPTRVDLPAHAAYADAAGSSPACWCEAIVS